MSLPPNPLDLIQAKVEQNRRARAAAAQIKQRTFQQRLGIPLPQPQASPNPQALAPTTPQGPQQPPPQPRQPQIPQNVPPVQAVPQRQDPQPFQEPGTRKFMKDLLGNFLFSFGRGLTAASQAQPGQGGVAAFGGALAGGEELRQRRLNEQILRENRGFRRQQLSNQTLTAQSNAGLTRAKLDQLQRSMDPQAFAVFMERLRLSGALEKLSVGQEFQAGQQQNSFDATAARQEDQQAHNSGENALRRVFGRAQQEDQQKFSTGLQEDRQLFTETQNRLRDSARIEAARVGRAEKPPNQLENRSFGFYLRMNNAVRDLNSIDDEIRSLGIFGQAALSLPNFLKSQTAQTLDRASRLFTEARLRLDSGAAIPEGEFKNDRITYFPVVGDTEQTLKDKRRSRMEEVAKLITGSGSAYKNSFGDSVAVRLPNGEGGFDEGLIPMQNLQRAFRKGAEIIP